VVGKCLYKALVPQSSHDVVQGLIQKGFAGTATENVEVQLHTKRNNTVDLLLNCTTNRDASGRAIGVIAIGQDISERKEVEMEKTRIAAELQTFIDTDNAPIFGIGLDGLVNQWIKKSAQLTGYSQEVIVGTSLQLGMIVEEFRAPLTSVLEQALEGKESSNFEVGCFTSSGDRIELLLNVTTKRDLSGAVVGVIGMHVSGTRLHACECFVWLRTYRGVNSSVFMHACMAEFEYNRCIQGWDKTLRRGS
jgi:PAS domain S-box-containing protein